MRPPERLRRVLGSVALTARGTGFLVAAVLLLLAAPLLSLPTLQHAAALLLGLVACSALFVTVGHSRVRVGRTFSPEVVPHGGSATASVHVTNLSPLPCVEAAWQDAVPAGVVAEAAGTVPALGRGGGSRSRVQLEYRLRGVRRGRHPIGPLRLEVQDPFGLVARRHDFGATQDLLVLPRRVELGSLRPGGADDEGLSRPSTRSAGVGEDDVVARAYLPGDALKRMHWKATAHRGELMVRQEEQQSSPRAAVVIDHDARSYGTTQDRRGGWEHAPALEWAVVATASVVAHLEQLGYAVAAQASGRSLDRRVVEGEDTLEDVLVDLALLEPVPRADVAPDDVTGGHRTTFVVLGRPDVERARQWTAALGGAGTVLALVQAGTEAAALEVLRDARWEVVPYRPDQDVADVWPELDGRRRRAAT